ncbi:FMN-binding protein [Haliangium sp.]|uniref:FMN-binding protein n=1 Tax=Haliangium sp. TaxID=2663208 RepID=UPI003D0FC5DB
MSGASATQAGAGAGAAPAAKPASAWLMYRALVGIGLVCGLLIVTAYQMTLPIIEAKRAEALRAAIFRVLPEARSSTTFAAGADGFRALAADEAAKADDEVVYAGYGEDGRLVGLAIEAEGMGYQDVIKILYGYSFEHDAIIGMAVLESRETPGLGDKIETDPAFVNNFERLDVSLDASGEAVANPIVPVKSGTKTDPWQVDTITGATISSTAVADILRNSSERWMPRVDARQADFEGGAP